MSRKLITANCPWCDKEFTSYGTLCCSASCAAKWRKLQQGTPPWRPEEIKVLEDLSGFKPLSKIVEKVQTVDRHNGWPLRTKEAVRREMERRGLSRNCTDDNISARKLAEALGVHEETVRAWIRLHDLHFKRFGSQRLAISLVQFRHWAQKNSRLLEGLEFERLMWALDDEEQARRLSSIKPRRKGIKVRLCRKDTGEIFDSVVEAAQKNFISPRTLHEHTRKGKQQFTSCGIAWEVCNG